MYDRIPCLNPTLSLNGNGRSAKVGLRGSRHKSFSAAERLAARTIIGPSCWEIQGCGVGPNGYGQIDLGGGKRAYTHRLAWELANGRAVPAGLRVLHSCDNPRCVNPAHLSIGTQRDNIRDSIRKGRFNCFGRQKLNADQVREIRVLAKAGVRQRDLARRFGVAAHTVSGIVNGTAWAHLAEYDAEMANAERVASVAVPVRGELHVGTLPSPIPSAQVNSLAEVI